MPPHSHPATSYLFMVLSEENKRREGEEQSQEGERGRGRRMGMGRRGLFWRLLSWLSSLTSTCTPTEPIDATTAEPALVPSTLLTGAGRPEFTRTLEKKQGCARWDSRRISCTDSPECVALGEPPDLHRLFTDSSVDNAPRGGLSSATLKGMLNFLERSQSHLYPSTQACPVFLAPQPLPVPPLHWPFSQAHT